MVKLELERWSLEVCGEAWVWREEMNVGSKFDCSFDCSLTFVVR